MVNAPCTNTSDPAIGSTCQVATTANAVMGGVVVAGKRANWELAQARVYAANDPRLFAVQGVFVP